MKTERFSRWFVVAMLMMGMHSAFGLSEGLPEPKIGFPKEFDAKRAEQLEAVLRSDKYKYLGGLTSYWPPDWGTTLVYGGDGKSLEGFLAAMSGVKGMAVRVTFSPDLSKETGSALKAGSWWVVYSHATPDVITVRVNLSAEELGGAEFALRWPGS